jgi:glycoside/pentoside/hexuronide:cation symporter, GPH family
MSEDIKSAPASALPPSRRISFGTKAFYGFGSIAFGIKDSGFRALLLIYYNQVVGLPAASVALAIMIALVVDAVMDPVIGEISDNWRSKWGRRHPFMYAAALPSAVSYFFLWFPPTDWSQGAQLGYLTVMAVVVRSFITIYEIPSQALVSEFTADYDKRTTLMSYRYLFFFVGGTLLTLLTYRVFLQPTPEFPVGQLNPNGYHKYAIVASTVILFSILVSAAGTHSQIRNLVQPPRLPNRSVWRLFMEMAQTLANKSFLTVTLAGLCKSAALGINGAINTYMLTYFWELHPSQIAILAIDTLFSASFAFALATPLTKKFGKKPVALVAYGFSFVLGVVPQLLRVSGVALQGHDPIIVPVLFVNSILFGTLGIMATILSGSMIADCVEDSQRKTGRRSEGLFFAANSLIGKAISGVGVFGAGMILAFVSFPQKAKPGEIAVDVVNSMSLTYVAVAGSLYAVGVCLLLAYRINRRIHTENLEAVSTSAPVLANATMDVEEP